MHDELRLPALPFERHHCKPRGIRSDSSTVIRPDQIQIQTRRGTG